MTTSLGRCVGVIVVIVLSALCLYHPTWGTPTEERRRLTGIWLDPKTTLEKSTSAATLTGIESLRFVAFGTSKTWGAGLKNPDTEAYIKLLSPQGVNLGLRATPASHPALCFHSMIGEQVFDVVIIEFSPYGGPDHQDFDRLVRRVRARFPSAIIIYLPIYMLLKDVSYQQKSLLDHMLSVGLQSPRDPIFNPTIRHLIQSDMAFPQARCSMADYVKTVNEVGGHIIEFPTVNRDLKSFVIDNAKYYATDSQPWDFVHPSALGHEVIANAIRHKVMQIRSQQPQISGNIGSWLGGKDHCMSWFSGENITQDIKGIHNMNMVNFSPWQGFGKWALEVAPHGGSLLVECLFPNCNIYVSYMFKGPNKEYPRVSISVNDQPKTLVDPNGNAEYHIRQLVHVGTVPKPGIVTVAIKPHDVTTHRFRITGLITSPTSLGERGPLGLFG